MASQSYCLYAMKRIKKKKVLILLLFFNLVIGCNNNKKQKTQIDEIAPQVNINLKQKEEPFLVKKFDDFFTDIALVPLKINDSSIIASIDKIIVYKSRYFVLDKKFSALYCFDKSGNLLTTYGRVGLGPGEYRRIDDFDIDSANNRIVVLSNDNLAIFYYSLNDASFLEQKRIGLFGYNIATVSNNKTLLFINYNINEKSKKNNIILLNSKGRIINTYFPFTTKEASFQFSFTGFMQKSNNKVFFCPAFGETVYVYANENFIPYAHFIINSDNIKNQQWDHMKIFKSGALLDPSTSFLRNTFLKNDNFIIFNYQKHKRLKFGIYNTKTDKLSILSKDELKEDPLSVLFKNLLYLGKDNTVVFSVSPELVSSVKKYNSKVWNKLSVEQKSILDLPNMESSYYLLVCKIKN